MCFFARFIYVENQYFMGSSKWWRNFNDSEYNIPCKHVIPYELAMRVVRAIRNQQRCVDVALFFSTLCTVVRLLLVH